MADGLIQNETTAARQAARYTKIIALRQIINISDVTSDGCIIIVVSLCNVLKLSSEA
jgi:hypothetical protein